MSKRRSSTPFRRWPLRTLLAGAASIRRDSRGVTAIEFAIVAPVLVLLFVPMADLGLGIYTDTQVANAAQYGAAYAMGYGYDSDKISAAVQASTGLTGLTVSSSEFCGCPDGDGGVTQTDCSSTCSQNLFAGTYVQVSVAKDYDTLLSYPGIPASFNLASQSTVRLQ